MENRIYAHFDIEADGPSPAINNMISIGISFQTSDGKEIARFLGDIKPLLNHKPDEQTLEEFWFKNENNKNEWKRIKENAKDYMVIMKELDDILKFLASKNYKIHWVANPAAYDWQWLKYYFELYSFNSKEPTFNIGYSAECSSTMRRIYRQINKMSQQDWDQKVKAIVGRDELTHNSLEDARDQAKVYYFLKGEFEKN